MSQCSAVPASHSIKLAKPVVGHSVVRFVVLIHDWPEPHWDFLVEADDVLRAWRLLAEPVPEVDIPAEPNFPHRLLYLDYEGPISSGRGHVLRWDTGTCVWATDGPDLVELEIRGTKLTGSVVVRRVGEGWRFRVTASAAG
ncbi:DNA polymerase ligase N-terminal domain-containing protein [Gemmata massiliana]|uniref:DNA polymerase ligase N-terminal domain-containing protein n=1 Tax=Gemmata massiliana TaxID=1210884 RepID=UPI0036F27E27